MCASGCCKEITYSCANITDTISECVTYESNDKLNTFINNTHNTSTCPNTTSGLLKAYLLETKAGLYGLIGLLGVNVIVFCCGCIQICWLCNKRKKQNDAIEKNLDPLC